MYIDTFTPEDGDIGIPYKITMYFRNSEDHTMNLHHCENLKPYPNTEDSRHYTVLCTGEVINHYTQYNTEINDPQWHQKNAVLLY